MRLRILFSAVCTAALALPALAGAPVASGASSPHFRLEWFSPAGGEAEMSSKGYRLRAAVSPPLSGLMRSVHFAIRPLLQSPDPEPLKGRVIVLRAHGAGDIPGGEGAICSMRRAYPERSHP